MQGHKLTDDIHQNISNTKDTGNILERIYFDIVLLSKQNQLPIPSISDDTIGVTTKDEDDATMENHIKTSMIEDLCKSLSFLVRWETENEMQNATANRSSDAQKAKDNEYSKALTIVNLSKAIMEFLDSDNASNLSPEELDRIVHGGLLDMYRIPSVANGFDIETVAFYDWWRRRIKDWIIREPSSRNSHDGGYYRLGWRHLTAMIQETRNHLRPPPRSVRVRGAGSKVVNGEYKLVSGNNLSQGARGGEEKQQHYYRYYSSQKLTYEKTTVEGRTLSLCLCVVDDSPTSTTQDQGNSLWFLSELDEEQPNTDCDTDYYCAPPRSGKNKRTNLIPPLGGWKRCSHGLFPPPTLVPVGAVPVPRSDSSDTHGQRLTRWILEEDVLATGWFWSNNNNNNNKLPGGDDVVVVDAGIASILELLIDFYEEDGGSNLAAQTGCSMGTELLVKFAAACLRGPHQRGRANEC
jgi:hypothetical protein